MSAPAWLIGFFSFLGMVCDATPGVKILWRWMVERPMEISTKLVPERCYVTHGKHGSFHARFQLRLVNHSTSTPQRIVGCHVNLKRSHCLFWRKTITSALVMTEHPDRPITDILLQPLSSPLEMDVWVHGNTGDIALPHKSWLVLVLDMVGPIRKIERELSRVVHEPTA